METTSGKGRQKLLMPYDQTHDPITMQFGICDKLIWWWIHSRHYGCDYAPAHTRSLRCKVTLAQLTNITSRLTPIRWMVNGTQYSRQQITQQRHTCSSIVRHVSSPLDSWGNLRLESLRMKPDVGEWYPTAAVLMLIIIMAMGLWAYGRTRESCTTSVWPTWTWRSWPSSCLV